MSVQQTRPPVPADSPPWYRRHVAELYRAVRCVIPAKRFTSSTDSYVDEFCRANNLKHERTDR